MIYRMGIKFIDVLSKSALFFLALFIGNLVFGQSPEKNKPLANEVANMELQPANQTESYDNLKDPFDPYLPADQSGAVSSVSPPSPAGFSSLGEPALPEEKEEKFDYSALKVSGFVWGTDKPKAIIDDKVVGKGDVVKDAEILNISKEGILFKYKGKEYLMKRESGSPSDKGGQV